MANRESTEPTELSRDAAEAVVRRIEYELSPAYAAEQRRLHEEKQKQIVKATQVERHGPNLGEPLFNYLHGNHQTEEARRLDRLAFATALDDALHNPDKDTRVQGLVALFEYFDTKVDHAEENTNDLRLSTFQRPFP